MLENNSIGFFNLTQSGKVLTDDAPLMKLGPAFAIDLELESEDPEKHPIAPKRRVQRTETIDSDILAVNVPDGTKI